MAPTAFRSAALAAFLSLAGEGSADAAAAAATAAFVPSAFAPSRRRSASVRPSALCMAGDSSNPFAAVKLPELSLPDFFGSSSDSSSSDSSSSSSSSPAPEGNTPEALFARAKSVLASDLGVRDPTLLADDFVWVGPNVVAGGTLGKEEYVAAGKFFDLRSAFPDLDYRAHDFRIDAEDPYTVRFTARTVGTMRGELRLRTETLPPNGRRMTCPPEAIGITFDPETGKVKKLCSGMVMDRLVGNTSGLSGVMGAAAVAGAPPSEWEIYPATAVIGRFFGRTVRQLEEPTSFLAPFPESVMVQLAKGVIAAENGLGDPDLLGDGFTYCAPSVGPLRKNDYLKEFGSKELKGAFPDLEVRYSNFRVDPYDPYRVWADSRATGTNTGPIDGKEPTGKRYESPPEASSFAFDDDGYCVRLTASAVMDPTEGNTGGLGGPEGAYYAAGRGSAGLATRTLGQNVARLQKRLLEPITGVKVDEVMGAAAKKAEPEPAAPAPKAPETPFFAAVEAAPKPKPPPAPKPAAAPKVPELKVPEVKLPPLPKLELPKATELKVPEVKLPPPPKVELPKPPAPKAPAAPKPKTVPKATVPKSTVKPPITSELADPVTEAFSSFFGTKAATSSPAAPSEDKAAVASAAEKRKAAAAAAQAKREEAAAAAASKKAEAEAKRQAAAEEAAAKKAEAAAAAKTKKEEAEAKKLAAAQAKKDAAAAAAAAKEEAAAAAQAKKDEAEAKRLAAAQAKEDAAAAAQAKKAEIEAKKQAAAEAAEAKKRAAAEAAAAKKAEIEAKKQAAAEAAEAKKRAAAEAAAAKKAEAEAKRLAAAQAKKGAAEAAAAAKKQKEDEAARRQLAAAAEAAAKKAKPGVTISLNFFAPWAKKKEPEATVADAEPKKKVPVPKRPTKRLARAPKGVPVLSEWVVNRNGSVTGYVEASNGMFEDGTQITTSPIKSGELEEGNVVETGSGSKYFLS
eukprot:CAMPEP_0183301296 /NCGR_PEP_ID=MMETSP0160_2-20130417/7460_1 /TAXON_ID=2839 ORGANISM="Odontella Sinensis, Strain Grunow 1884" /NCGR_SAMPLE_ID=MMETSP0160_2 /ASSEMBLY_ACC=CAM_ASM_000250 /LENGTH=962 /DNA_ID=CAMNT_0025463889 /DNA_START=44 /DNA_END=2932 /DNA_ORIENTATION=+